MDNATSQRLHLLCEFYCPRRRDQLFASIESFRRSSNFVLDAARYATAWVALADHVIDPKELTALHAMVPDYPGGVALTTMIEALRAANAKHDFQLTVKVFQGLREGLPEHSKTPFIHQIVDIAAADGMVSQGERHAIIFLAEMLSRADEAEEIFNERTGLDLYEIHDLSNPSAWDTIEQTRQRKRRERTKNTREDESRSSHSDRDRDSRWQQQDGSASASRVAALAILGLVGSPSQEEIRQAYRSLARIHHPDRYATMGVDAVRNATRNFQRIQNAYESLTL